MNFIDSTKEWCYNYKMTQFTKNLRGVKEVCGDNFTIVAPIKNEAIRYITQQRYQKANKHAFAGESGIAEFRLLTNFRVSYVRDPI